MRFESIAHFSGRKVAAGVLPNGRNEYDKKDNQEGVSDATDGVETPTHAK